MGEVPQQIMLPWPLRDEVRRYSEDILVPDDECSKTEERKSYVKRLLLLLHIIPALLDNLSDLPILYTLWHQGNHELFWISLAIDLLPGPVAAYQFAILGYKRAMVFLLFHPINIVLYTILAVININDKLTDFAKKVTLYCRESQALLESPLQIIFTVTLMCHGILPTPWQKAFVIKNSFGNAINMNFFPVLSVAFSLLAIVFSAGGTVNLTENIKAHHVKRTVTWIIFLTSNIMFRLQAWVILCTFLVEYVGVVVILMFIFNLSVFLLTQVSVKIDPLLCSLYSLVVPITFMKSMNKSNQIDDEFRYVKKINIILALGGTTLLLAALWLLNQLLPHLSYNNNIVVDRDVLLSLMISTTLLGVAVILTTIFVSTSTLSGAISGLHEKVVEAADSLNSSMYATVLCSSTNTMPPMTPVVLKRAVIKIEVGGQMVNLEPEKKQRFPSQQQQQQQQQQPMVYWWSNKIHVKDWVKRVMHTLLKIIFRTLILACVLLVIALPYFYRSNRSVSYRFQLEVCGSTTTETFYGYGYGQAISSSTNNTPTLHKCPGYLQFDHEALGTQFEPLACMTSTKPTNSTRLILIDRGYATPLPSVVMHLEQIVLVAANQKGLFADKIKDLKQCADDPDIVLAAQGGNVEAVEDLLRGGAQVDETTKYGHTALHEAAIRVSVDIAALLLNHGANVNATTTDTASTPLHFAAKAGNMSMVSLLTENQASLEARDGLGETPMLVAARFGHWDLVDYLKSDDGGGGKIEDKTQGYLNVLRMLIRLLSNETADPVLTRLKEELSAVREAVCRQVGEKSDFTLIDCQTVKAKSSTSLSSWNNGLYLHMLEVFSDVTRTITELPNANKDFLGEEGYTLMSAAAQMGEDRMVAILLESGADPNLANIDNSQTPLHLACKFGHVDTIELLLEHRKTVKVDPVDADGNTPLFHCGDSLPGVRALVAAGANLEHVNRDGATPLMAFLNQSSGGSEMSAEYLVNSGANVRATMGLTGKQSVLQIACSRGLPRSMAKLLIERGADFTYRDEGGDTAFSLACAAGNSDVVQYMLESGLGIVGTRNTDGMTPLALAVSNGQAKVAEILLGSNNGSSNQLLLNERDVKGYAPLHHACQKRHVRLIQILLSYKTVDAKDQNGQTPLFACALNGLVTGINLLLGKEAQINHRDRDGRTPLMSTAFNGSSVDAALHLLANGAGADYTDYVKNQSVLHLAAQNQQALRLVDALVKSGIPEHGLRDADGVTAFDAACAAGNIKVVRYMTENGLGDINRDSQGYTPLQKAIWGGHSGVVEYLLDINSNTNNSNNSNNNNFISIINLPNYKGNAPLHNACKNRQPDTIRALLNHSETEVNLVSVESGGTALTFCAESGLISGAKMLLEKGARIDHSDYDRWTPLMKSARNNDMQMSLFLVEQGANVSAIGNNLQQNVLMLACQNIHNPTMTKVLLDKGADYKYLDTMGCPAFFYACAWGNFLVAQYMLDNNYGNMSQRDHTGKTPLIWAVYFGKPYAERVIEVLLLSQGGTDVLNVADDQGFTPLHHAVRGKSLEVLRVLLKFKPDKTLRDKGGNLTATEMARQRRKEDFATLIENT